MGKIRLAQGVTLIAANTEVVGDVRFRTQLFVDGLVEGAIHAGAEDGATLIISERGSVRGDIRVPNVVINGAVEGNVYAGSRVELGAKARVKGNVYYRLIEMQLGAMVDGQLLHDEDGAAESPGKVHPFPTEAGVEPVPGREAGRSAEGR